MIQRSRYADGLAALSDGTLVSGRIAAWAAEHGLPTFGWEREYGRFHPGQSPWAVLAYAHPHGLAIRVDVATTPRDWEQISVVPAAADPGLPGLAAVLARLSNPRIVRYRPGHRCTVHGQTPQGPIFVKVAPGGAQVHADAERLWPIRAALPFAIAEPRGWDERTDSAWYGVVPGRPIVADVLGPDGALVVHRLATALAALAAAPVQPSRTEGPHEQLARSRRAARRAAAAVPELREPLATVLSDLECVHDRLIRKPLVPVHGAPHMRQWLDDGGRLGLIDFDRFALGEPELDLATFLAELDTESDRRLPMTDLEAAAVAGFEDNGVGLDPARLALYRAHKRLAKVTRTACSLRADGDQRAVRHLRGVEAALLGACS